MLQDIRTSFLILRLVRHELLELYEYIGISSRNISYCNVFLSLLMNGTWGGLINSKKYCLISFMMPLFLRSRYIQTNCLVQNCCFSSNGSFKNVIFSDISPLLLSFKMVYKLHNHFLNMCDLLFDTLYHWIFISNSAYTFKFYENVYFLFKA